MVIKISDPIVIKIDADIEDARPQEPLSVLVHFHWPEKFDPDCLA